MGQCATCGKETLKILFKKAAVSIFVCSETCLQKYFEPIGGVDVPRKLGPSESWLTNGEAEMPSSRLRPTDRGRHRA